MSVLLPTLRTSLLDLTTKRSLTAQLKVWVGHDLDCQFLRSELHHHSRRLRQSAVVVVHHLQKPRQQPLLPFPRTWRCFSLLLFSNVSHFSKSQYLEVLWVQFVSTRIQVNAVLASLQSVMSRPRHHGAPDLFKGKNESRSLVLKKVRQGRTHAS